MGVGGERRRQSFATSLVFSRVGGPMAHKSASQMVSGASDDPSLVVDSPAILLLGTCLGHAHSGRQESPRCSPHPAQSLTTHLNRGWTLATESGPSPPGPVFAGSQSLGPCSPRRRPSSVFLCARLCGHLRPACRQPLRWGISLGDSVLDHGVSSVIKLLCDLGQAPLWPL